MSKLTFQQQTISIDPSKSVLETLENAGFKIPFSCRSGVCHACMMQAQGDIPAAAQQGLSSSQIAQQFFLACSCYPTSPLSLSLINDRQLVPVKVIAKKMLNDSVVGLFLSTDLQWFPGQYVTVWFDEQQGRSYSIASRCIEDPTHQEKVLELHIKRHDQGLVSRWLHDDVNIGDQLMVSTPGGNCFYTDDHFDKPLLMAATGTGLAPLYGILSEALAKGHTQPIHCYAAAGDVDGLYHQQALWELAKHYENFHYWPLVKRLPPEDQLTNALPLPYEAYLNGDLVEQVLQRHPDLKGWKIFMCGSPVMIKQLQKRCFFQGASIPDMLADAFEMQVPTGES